MDKDFEAQYHELEEQHWWFQARRDIIIKLLSNIDLPDRTSILEVGCSGGPLMNRLVALGFEDTIGIDLSEEGVALAKRRGHNRVAVMNGAQLGIGDAKFDMVIASDILEHIDRDDEALHEWHRVMRPGGWLLVFVPAFMMLWSPHDEVNHHFRRYRKAQLRTLLEKADFNVVRTSYWNSILFAPVAAVRLMGRLLPQGQKDLSANDLSRSNQLINSSLYSLLKVENSLLGRGLNFPFGVSVWALARKGYPADPL